MYRTVDARFWSDPKVRSLPAEGKLLMLYLVTNGHSHVSGIYYLPRTLMAYEVGLSVAKLDTLCDTLSGLGLAKFDQKKEVVWVVRMLKYQGKGEKNYRSSAKNLESLHNSFLINEFLSYYPQIKPFVKIGYPIPYPAQDGIGTQEQEQEQEPPPTPPGGEGGETDDGFDTFWEAYPRHEGKKAARAAWTKLKPGAEVRAAIMAAVERQKTWDAWVRGFAPHASTWLNGERWKDEPRPPLLNGQPAASAAAQGETPESLRSQLPAKPALRLLPTPKEGESRVQA